MLCRSCPDLAIIKSRFAKLYGDKVVDRCMQRLELLINHHQRNDDHQVQARRWDEEDVMLITYGDMLMQENTTPLSALDEFMHKKLQEQFSTIHILPFFPYSSDDGFSIIDYRQVNPALGDWEDIERLGRNFDLMFDLVLNHVSRESEWFKEYTNGIMPFKSYFIEVSSDTDLSAVVRPRNLPLLTPTRTREGLRYLWTTFSSDQIDLDFTNPDVLFEFLEIMLHYAERGARFIRLDAIAYLWKEPGTSCIHLPQTHEIVKLMRDIIDMVGNNLIILTETNVPHQENISYFGNGDEAHMVYQFTLPPLLLHTLTTGSAKKLTDWAATLESPPQGCTFFNFTASHDGIGVRPLEGILSTREIADLAETMKARGGVVSTKDNGDGSQSPYEINITYFSALANPEQSNQKLDIARFMCSQTIPLQLRGIPGIYFNNLIGAVNDIETMNQQNKPRAINRHKWKIEEIESLIADKTNPHAQIFNEHKRLLKIRRQHPAFHPDAPQAIADFGEAMFAVLRTSQSGDEEILALNNVTDTDATVPLAKVIKKLGDDEIIDLLADGRTVDSTAAILKLAPYQSAWLTTACNDD